MSLERWDDGKQRIKDSLNINSVVESYLPLRRSGHNFKACCPFHSEKTPSFFVFPETDTFKCFGCGKGGDIFTFVQEKENVGFREAMELLAAKAGITLEATMASGTRSNAGSLRSILDMAKDFFTWSLREPAGIIARDYLEKRGLAPAIEPFALGYSPSSWTALVDHARNLGVDMDLLVQAGLARHGNRGLHDYFHNRLMIPIRDVLGRVVGFGARVLDGGEPKYLNSPDSPVFSKRKVLYGLDRARKAKTGRLLVVEGYTDLMAAELAGVEGVVAGLGTALTEDHGHLLERYGDGPVVLLYDGDGAGRKAAEKALGELVGFRLDLRVALLGNGIDPADLVAKEGGAALQALAGQAEAGFKVKLDLVSNRYDIASPTGAAQAAKELTEYLVKVDDPVRLERLVREAAGRLRVKPDALARAVDLAAGRKRRYRIEEKSGPDGASTSPATPAPELLPQERILEAILHEPVLLGEIDPDLITDNCCKRLLQNIFQLVENIGAQGSFPWDQLLDSVRDDTLLVAKITGWRNRPTAVKNRATWLKQSVLSLIRLRADRRATTLDKAICSAREAGEDSRVLELRREKNRLNRERIDQLQQLQGMEE